MPLHLQNWSLVYVLCALSSAPQLLTTTIGSFVLAVAANFLAVVPAIVVVALLLLLRWYFLTNIVVIKRLESVG